MTIRGILFDIGDTLVAATALQERALRAATRALAAQGWFAADDFLRAYRAADREPQFAETSDLNHMYADARILARAGELLLAKRFLRIHRKTLRQSLLPDARQIAVFKKLRGADIRLGIVSNGTTVEQLDQLKRLRIEKFFDPILISQAVKIRKPDPRILRIAARQWRLPAKEILVVGDRADWEVLCAKRAGMQSALTIEFVDQRKTITPKTRPDFIIGELSAVLDLISEER